MARIFLSSVTIFPGAFQPFMMGCNLDDSLRIYWPRACQRVDGFIVFM